MVRRRQHVGFGVSVVRREGGGLTLSVFEEVAGVTKRGLREGPIGRDDPLVALGVPCKHFGLQRVVSRDHLVAPRRRFIVHLEQQGLDFTFHHIDGDGSKNGFVTCLDFFGTSRHRVPNRRSTGG